MPLYATPTWQSWSPTLSGWSANPASGIYRYAQIGKLVFCQIRQPNTGTSNATSTSITVPVTPATIANQIWIGSAFVTDNGAAKTAPGRVQVVSAGTTIDFLSDFASGAWTASGAKAINIAFITYEAA